MARLQWVPALLLPAPTAVLLEAGRMAWSHELWRNLEVSLVRVGLGSGLGAAVGILNSGDLMLTGKLDGPVQGGGLG